MMVPNVALEHTQNVHSHPQMDSQIIVQQQQQQQQQAQEQQYQTSPPIVHQQQSDAIITADSSSQQNQTHSSTPDRIPMSADANIAAATQSDGQTGDNSEQSAGQQRPAPASAPATTVASKSRRSNKSTERIPKLVVMSVQNGTLVDCSMENKQKTITFKFDISDVNPVDVANDLVSIQYIAFLLRFFFFHRSIIILNHMKHSRIFQISKDLLSNSQSSVFADMVRDIVRQLKLNPNQIPVPSAHRRTAGIDKVCFEIVYFYSYIYYCMT